MCRQHSSIFNMPNISQKRCFLKKYFHFFVTIFSTQKAKPCGFAPISYPKFFPQLIDFLSFLISNLTPLKILLPKLLTFFFKHFSVCFFEVFAVELPFLLAVKKDVVLFCFFNLFCRFFFLLFSAFQC